MVYSLQVGKIFLQFYKPSYIRLIFKFIGFTLDMRLYWYLESKRGTELLWNHLNLVWTCDSGISLPTYILCGAGWFMEPLSHFRDQIQTQWNHEMVVNFYCVHLWKLISMIIWSVWKRQVVPLSFYASSSDSECLNT